MSSDASQVPVSPDAPATAGDHGHGQASLGAMALAAMGVVYGDISTNNIIEHQSTGRFVLIDFETAFRPEVDRGHNAFTPGYAFSERLYRGVAESRDDIIGAGAVSDYHHVPGIRLDDRATLVASACVRRITVNWRDVS